MTTRSKQRGNATFPRTKSLFLKVCLSKTVTEIHTVRNPPAAIYIDADGESHSYGNTLDQGLDFFVLSTVHSLYNCCWRLCDSMKGIHSGEQNHVSAHQQMQVYIHSNS